MLRKTCCFSPPCWKVKMEEDPGFFAMPASRGKYDLDKRTVGFMLLTMPEYTV